MLVFQSQHEYLLCFRAAQVFCLCGVPAFALAALLAVLPLRGCTTSLLCDADVGFPAHGHLCVHTVPPQYGRVGVCRFFCMSRSVCVPGRTACSGCEALCPCHKKICSKSQRMHAPSVRDGIQIVSGSLTSSVCVCKHGARI